MSARHTLATCEEGDCSYCASYVTPSRRAVVCGTRAGYQKHIRSGTPTCQPCREANAAWRKQYRKDSPQEYGHEKRMHRARMRALWQLARLHRDEFRRLVNEELKGDAA